jgi:hypothetical protein
LTRREPSRDHDPPERWRIGAADKGLCGSYGVTKHIENGVAEAMPHIIDTLSATARS